MNDENDKPESIGPDDEEQPLLAGERLADARRERQITVLEISKELHLDESKVRALESNDFDTLGAPVFAKGHLRKYANIVGIDENDVLAEYYGLTRSQPLPPVVSERRKPGRELSPGPWIIVAIVAAAVAFAFWFLTRPPSPGVPANDAAPAETTVPEDTSPPDETTSPALEDEELPTDDADEQVSAEQETTEPEELVEPEPAETPPAEPAAANVSLSIVFEGDCWAEIFDASGRRLFYAMGSAGQSVELVGESPLSVLFGDADNVSLTVNGAEFTIADADRRGRTARFNLYGY